MIACGHGFVIAHPAPAPLVDFLQRKVNTFSCDQVAGQLDLSTQYLFQGAWRYLMYAVGITWRLVGVSWTRMGPLFGVLFGLTIVSAYGVFRLASNRWLAIAGAFLLSVSALHLSNLPNLRDYSKAPFTLAAVFLLGLLVKLKVRRATVVTLSAAYGIVLGVGYGFRTDFLVNVPAILAVLFFFLEGGLRRHLLTKVLGAGAFFVAFFITAWPILSFVNEKGGGQYHVAILGMTLPYDEALRIQSAPYDLAQVYDDMYVARTTAGYVARVHPEWRDMIYFTHQYDLATGAYLKEIVSRFPGDMATRALASTFAITEAPFTWPGPPMPDLARWLYRPREIVLGLLKGLGPLLALAAIVAAAAYDLRIGLFFVFFVLYFGGYPSIQFAARHYFHLELITWTALGLLLHGLLVRRRPPAGALRRIGILCGVLAALVASLGVIRLYQAAQARRLFAEYERAAKAPIPSDASRRDANGFIHIPGPSRDADVRLLEVDVDASACEANAKVDFRYDARPPSNNYSRQVSIPPSAARSLTRVFAPVYAPAFQGVQLPAGGPSCVAGMYWVDTARQPLVLDVTLAPSWEQRVLYQRMPFEPAFGAQ